MRKRAERSELEQLVEALLPLCGFQALQIGIEVEILLDGEVFIKTEALRHVADHLLNGRGRLPHVQAQHPHLARTGQQQGCGKADQRGLARAVWPEQAGDAPLLNAHIDAFEGIDHGAALPELLMHRSKFERHASGRHLD